MAFLSIAGLCLGNACNSPSGGGTGGTAGTGGSGGSGGSNTVNPIDGTYIERYNCKLDDGTCVGVDVRIEMEVTDLGGGQYEIDDLGSNGTGTGTRTGDRLDWTSTDPDFPGFSETGTWFFTFAPGSTTFTKTSEFIQDQGMPGDCTGNGRLASEGEPDAPLPFNPPCTPQ